MTPLLLVGTGPTAREVAAAIVAINAHSPMWDLVGLLDDDPETHGRLIGDARVLGDIGKINGFPGAQLAVCTPNARSRWSRRDLVNRLAPDQPQFATIIHPSASLAPDTIVGAGTVVLANAVATAAVTIGSHVIIEAGVVLTPDDVIGDFATLASGVQLRADVTVGPGAYLGAGSVVRERLRIGAGSELGMGAVAMSDVPPGETWAGVPARPVRKGRVIDLRDVTSNR